MRAAMRASRKGSGRVKLPEEVSFLAVALQETGVTAEDMFADFVCGGREKYEELIFWAGEEAYEAL